MKVFEISKVLRFFKDELSGDECAVILSKEGEEICVTADVANNWMDRIFLNTSGNSCEFEKVCLY